MRHVILLVALLAVFTGAAGGAVSGPAAPTNLEVVSATQDSITLAWGPSQPGGFYNAGEGSNYVMVAWGTSQDSRGPVTYKLSKDGAVIANGLTTNVYRITFPPGKGKKGAVSTFRTCVTAYLADGRASPPTCGTWTR